LGIEVQFDLFEATQKASNRGFNL